MFSRLQNEAFVETEYDRLQIAIIQYKGRIVVRRGRVTGVFDRVEFVGSEWID